MIYINPSGRRVSVSAHAGKVLHPKVIKSILADAGLTVEGFIRLLAE